ncbi:TPA: DUF2474 domain-containing protein [Salmonella enterica]|uniref:DUF2474 domain-containing protein n=1 Tax=Salmonella enterica TaxID=28901 RepID=A0A743AUW6_SALER|nr:DUF2474 family protein [Klebsiella pneumoniae]HAF1690111.1 DUF2474 domain-containing protein [Salmonella enterica]HBV9912670.1 DUF2474 domain-containing protein [Klebsiella aerogenes]HAF1985358.1 DUF2474 domain-containing protein [Salmonella enterica]HAF4408257.1 DUF2474 domain-containing protein [Salmonella enterica]
MKGITETRIKVGSMKNNETQPSVWKRLAWLVIIYGASVLALGVVASLFRMLMSAAGMHTH